MPDTRMDQSGLSINSWFVMIITGEKNEFLEARRVSDFRSAGKKTLLLFCFVLTAAARSLVGDQASFSMHARFFFPKYPAQVETKCFGHMKTSTDERGMTSYSPSSPGEYA